MIEEQYAKYDENRKHMAFITEESDAFRLHKFHDLYNKNPSETEDTLENNSI